eukprot:1250860-Pleurochrysis_carterae.AAC.1
MCAWLCTRPSAHVAARVAVHLTVAVDLSAAAMLRRHRVSPTFYGFRWITLLMTQESERAAPPRPFVTLTDTPTRANARTGARARARVRNPTLLRPHACTCIHAGIQRHVRAREYSRGQLSSRQAPTMFRVHVNCGSLTPFPHRRQSGLSRLQKDDFVAVTYFPVSGH